jgi:hypothetical protein
MIALIAKKEESPTAYRVIAASSIRSHSHSGVVKIFYTMRIMLYFILDIVLELISFAQNIASYVFPSDFALNSSIGPVSHSKSRDTVEGESKI